MQKGKVNLVWVFCTIILSSIIFEVIVFQIVPSPPQEGMELILSYLFFFVFVVTGFFGALFFGVFTYFGVFSVLVLISTVISVPLIFLGVKGQKWKAVLGGILWSFSGAVGLFIGVCNAI